MTIIPSRVTRELQYSEYIKQRYKQVKSQYLRLEGKDAEKREGMHGRGRNKLLAKASNFLKRPDCFMYIIVSLMIFSLVTHHYYHTSKYIRQNSYVGACDFAYFAQTSCS